MAMNGVIKMPVVDRDTGLICGSISAQELLTGRRRAVVRSQSGTDPSWLRCKEKDDSSWDSNGLQDPS